MWCLSGILLWRFPATEPQRLSSPSLGAWGGRVLRGPPIPAGSGFRLQHKRMLPLERRPCSPPTAGMLGTAADSPRGFGLLGSSQDFLKKKETNAVRKNWNVFSPPILYRTENLPKKPQSEKLLFFLILMVLVWNSSCLLYLKGLDFLGGQESRDELTNLSGGWEAGVNGARRTLKAEHKNFVRRKRSGKNLKWKIRRRESRVRRHYQPSCCSTSV